MIIKTKIKAFTLSEMIIVLILTSVVVGIAFSVLTLVQKHISLIQTHFENTSELNRLKKSLSLDFNRFTDIKYDSDEAILIFRSELEMCNYKFETHQIIKDRDTFFIPLEQKAMYFDGEKNAFGKVDAIKLETTKEFQNKTLFIYRTNSAYEFMD